MTTGLDPLTRVGLGEGSPEYHLAFYTSLSAALTAIGSSHGTLVIDTAIAANGLTIPANVTLRFVNSGQFTGTGTVTIVGGMAGDAYDRPRQLFASTLTVRFTGNKTLFQFYHEWWGAVGDGSTDDTANVQRAWDDVAASNLDAIMQFLPRIYKINGSLQDTSNSNSQLVLPKRNGNSELFVFCLRGASPATTFAINTLGGTVLKSTLGSGTGAVIGVKTTFTFAGTTGVTHLSFHAQDFTIQTVDNPTLTGMDLRYVPNQTYENVKVITGTDATITEPTTSSSYGIKTALNNVPDVVRMRNVQVTGFYNGILAGELINGDDVVVNFAKVGIEIPEAFHSLRFGRLLFTETVDCIKFTGSAYVQIDNYDADHNTGGWWAHSHDIVDTSDLGHGIIIAHAHLQDTGIDDIIMNGGRRLQVRHLRRAHISRYNYAEPFTSAYASEMALIEAYSNESTSDDTKFGAFSGGANQSGTDHTLMSVFFNNYSLSGERRVGIIQCKTAGATNSGRINFATMNAGTISTKLAIMNNSIRLALANVPVYANNAAAITGGLLEGDLYRIGGDPDHLCIVH